jgi:hypothetical protein
MNIFVWAVLVLFFHRSHAHTLDTKTNASFLKCKHKNLVEDTPSVADWQSPQFNSVNETLLESELSKAQCAADQNFLHPWPKRNACHINILSDGGSDGGRKAEPFRIGFSDPNKPAQ